jgi:uncharacterized membrane protein YccC
MVDHSSTATGMAIETNNGQLRDWLIAKDNPPSVAHAAQLSVAVVVSFLTARWFRLQEAYWAPMTTLLVMQATLHAALPVAAQYFAATGVGACVGAIMDTYFPGNIWVFGVAVFVIGLFAAGFRIDRSAYRNAAVTLAIVMLVPHHTTAPRMAFHRFLVVSIGLAVGLGLFAFWQKIETGFTKAH